MKLPIARFLIGVLIVSVACWAADPDPRGIFISSTAPGSANANHPAVKFQIELVQNGQPTPVAATYRFKSGDRFRIRFELNQSSYIYVVNRSVNGNPEELTPLLGTRGINVVEQSPAAPPTPLQLLWPKAGTNARLAAGQPQAVPGATQTFQFDAQPGLEKLALLVSQNPVDPSAYFTGLPTVARPAAATVREDTNPDVLARLDDLRSLESNTVTDSGASRGICVGDCSQYSAPVNSARPFILTVDLIHTR